MIPMIKTLFLLCFISILRVTNLFLERTDSKEANYKHGIEDQLCAPEEDGYELDLPLLGEQVHLPISENKILYKQPNA